MVSINRDSLADKVLAGERITPEEALLLNEWPLEELGVLADARRRTGEAVVLQRPRQGDRHLHRRSQHQLHQRLQCLLQVLRVLPHGKRRRSLRHLFRRAGREDRRINRGGRRANFDAGRTSSEARLRMVHRSCCSTSAKNIRTSTSTDSVRRSFNISRNVFEMPLREVIAAIQRSRPRLDPGRRRRNSGGSGAAREFRR